MKPTRRVCFCCKSERGKLGGLVKARPLATMREDDDVHYYMRKLKNSEIKNQKCIEKQKKKKARLRGVNLRVVVKTAPFALFGCGDVMMDRRRDQAGRREMREGGFY